jgi:hypothetical protein
MTEVDTFDANGFEVVRGEDGPKVRSVSASAFESTSIGSLI